MKKIILAVLIILAFGAAIFAPWGISSGMEQLNTVRYAADQYREVQGELNQKVAGLDAAKSSFDGQRTFEVHYSDVDTIITLLNNVMGISVSNVVSVDAQNNFSTVGPYSSESVIVPSAIQVSLVTEDPVAALRAINRMNLPIYSVEVQEPTAVMVTFLTGGGLS